MPSSRKLLKAAPAPAELRRSQEKKSPFHSGRGAVTLDIAFFTSGAQQLPRYEKKTMQKLIFSHARPKKAQIKTSPPGVPGGDDSDHGSLRHRSGAGAAHHFRSEGGSQSFVCSFQIHPVGEMIVSILISTADSPIALFRSSGQISHVWTMR